MYLPKYIAQASLLFAAISTATGFAQTYKISPDLQPVMATPGPPARVNVIVQYRTPPCTSNNLIGVLCAHVNLLSGTVTAVHSVINAVSASVSSDELVALSRQPNVSYISPNRNLIASLDYSTAAVSAPTPTWNGVYDGSGIGIAVIDSGIYPHPDLSAGNSVISRVVYHHSFIGGSQYDDFGHGTHVAGIIAGNGRTSNVPGSKHVLRGVAPNAQLLDLRVLDANGVSNDTAVIAAIDQAVQLKNIYNVRVINLSLGRPIYESCNTDPLCQAVESAWRNGIVVIVAAGNLGRNGYATVLSPANAPHAITVGAMKTLATYPNTDDLIASYSSKGPTFIDLTAKPDVVAPGNLVVSLLAPGSTLAAEFPADVIPPSYYSPSNVNVVGPPQYMRLSGTSMATPVVVGAVAIMLQKDPTLSPDTIKARLMKTAGKSFPVTSTATDPTTGKTYVSTYDLFTIGAGYINIAAALSNYDVATRSAASPSVLYLPFANVAFLGMPFDSLWNSSPPWTTNAVWGTTVVGPVGTVWNASNVWSTSSQWGTMVSWGTSGQWGTMVSWGTSGYGEN